MDDLDPPPQVGLGRAVAEVVGWLALMAAWTWELLGDPPTWVMVAGLIGAVALFALSVSEIVIRLRARRRA